MGLVAECKSARTIAWPSQGEHRGSGIPKRMPRNGAGEKLWPFENHLAARIVENHFEVLQHAEADVPGQAAIHR